MQIVISISNSFYDRLKDMDIDNDTCSFNESALVDIIQKSTPLPKGHGRLVDADELWSKRQNPYGGFRMWIEDFDLAQAPTIIEADKAESEEK